MARTPSVDMPIDNSGFTVGADGAPSSFAGVRVDVVSVSKAMVAMFHSRTPVPIMASATSSFERAGGDVRNGVFGGTDEEYAGWAAASGIVNREGGIAAPGRRPCLR